MSRKLFLPLAVLVFFSSAIAVYSLSNDTPTSCYPPLSLVTTSVPSGTAGSSYSVPLSGAGGQPPYTWSFGRSSLPSGFSISSSGDVTGTPSKSGTYTFNVVLSDSLKDNVTGALTLIVAAAPTGTTGTGTGTTGTTGTGTGTGTTGTTGTGTGTTGTTGTGTGTTGTTGTGTGTTGTTGTGTGTTGTTGTGTGTGTTGTTGTGTGTTGTTGTGTGTTGTTGTGTGTTGTTGTGTGTTGTTGTGTGTTGTTGTGTGTTGTTGTGTGTTGTTGTGTGTTGTTGTGTGTTGTTGTGTGTTGTTGTGTGTTGTTGTGTGTTGTTGTGTGTTGTTGTGTGTTGTTGTGTGTTGTTGTGTGTTGTTGTGSGGSGQVATPTLSVSSGSQAPGTTTTSSDSTGGATIYYTTDGSTPTYDPSTYLPGFGTTTAILGTAGSSGITAGNTFVPSLLISGPMTVKLLAAKSGMSDSEVATYTYTQNTPTGTALSACGKISGSNYLTTDVSSAGTCFIINGNNTTLNLNGHTITFGTASGAVLQGTTSVTSGSSVIPCPSCTTAMIGDNMEVDNYNSNGGYSNNWSGVYNSPTITAVSGGNATLSSAPGFSASSAEYIVYAPPVDGVLCDPSIAGNCANLVIENGTITQGSSMDGPGSSAIMVNPHGYGTQGPVTAANLTANISGPEAEFVYLTGITGGNVVANNVVNDSVKTIYYRDGLPYPIKLDGGGHRPATSVNYVHDNKVIGSPQGDVYAGFTSNVMNNYFNHNGGYQYANGFCEFAAVNNDVFMGNSCNGDMQGMEEEASNDSFVNNYTAITMHDPVTDPNHNPPQCELGYGYREKDFGGTTGDPLLSGGSGVQFVNVLNYNVFNDTDGACGANDIEFSQVFPNDTTSVVGNVLTLTMSTSNPTNTSEIFGADDSNLSGVTYSGNTATIVGPYASQGVMAYFNYDQVLNWTLPDLVNPSIVWRQGSSGLNSTGKFTGTGTASCTTLGNSGSSSAITLTFNGSAVTCH